MDPLALIARHGPALLALLCFVEAVGLPLPAALALLGGGAMAYQGKFHAGLAFFAGLGGLVLGDILLYVVGRTTGWYFLGILCRLSANPESCIYQSANTFYQRGRLALLFTKFIPGINTMAAPLAGSLRMPPGQFLLFDLGGATLYAGVYFGAGYLFSDLLGAMAAAMASAGGFLKSLLVGGVIGYVVYRVWLGWKLRADFLDIPRVAPEIAAREMAEGVVLDVRSHGYYGSSAVRVQGSSRLEPNRLNDALVELPEDKKIYLYCT